MKGLILFFLALNINAKCYKVDKKDFELKFTGYKFTEKVGVSGTFKNMSFSTIKKGNLTEIISNAMLWIDTNSIDAGKGT